MVREYESATIAPIYFFIYHFFHLSKVILDKLASVSELEKIVITRDGFNGLLWNCNLVDLKHLLLC